VEEGEEVELCEKVQYGPESYEVDGQVRQAQNVQV